MNRFPNPVFENKILHSLGSDVWFNNIMPYKFRAHDQGKGLTHKLHGFIQATLIVWLSSFIPSSSETPPPSRAQSPSRLARKRRALCSFKSQKMSALGNNQANLLNFFITFHFKYFCKFPKSFCVILFPHTSLRSLLL